MSFLKRRNHRCAAEHNIQFTPLSSIPPAVAGEVAVALGRCQEQSPLHDELGRFGRLDGARVHLRGPSSLRHQSFTVRLRKACFPRPNASTVRKYSLTAWDAPTRVRWATLHAVMEMKGARHRRRL